MDTEFFLCFLSSHPELSLLPKSNETSPAVIELSSSLVSTKAYHCGSYSVERGYFWPILRLLMACYPAWIRFLQCLRRFHDDGSGTHLYNTAKYSTSFLKYGMAFYYAQEPTQSSFSLMCCAYFCSSAFTLYWDLIHDWVFFWRRIRKIRFYEMILLIPHEMARKSFITLQFSKTLYFDSAG